ncbi:MAG: amidase family protein [Hyphomonadaceae bacterium]|nr:amidase family protein [Hyphomonadaceae bacterium]
MISRRQALLSVSAGLVWPGVAKAQSTSEWPADAIAFAAALRSRAWTAEAAARSAVERCMAASQLNLAVALDVPQALARLEGPEAPLGIPTLVKDLDDLPPFPTGLGMRNRASEAPASEIAPYVERLARLGLNPVGKSATSEFGLLPMSANQSGFTSTPWALGRSSGGSSGGGASAVAGGIVPLAHASDAGGSIRIPASYCGVFGFKPSRGRTLGSGSRGSTSLIARHVITRSVRDSALVLAANELDGAQAQFPPEGLIDGPSSQRLRIGVVRPTIEGLEPESAVADALDRVLAGLARLGHHISETTWPFDGARVGAAFTDIWAFEAARSVEALPRQQRDQLTRSTRELAELGAAQSSAASSHATLIAETSTQYEAWFERFDVMLSPTSACLPPLHAALDPEQSWDAFRPVLSQVAGYTPLQNLVGAPAMSAPLEMSPEGLPIGMHFFTRAGGDGSLMRLAFELEQEFSWRDRRPANWYG